MPCPTGKAQYATSTAAARVMQRVDKRHGHKPDGWSRGPVVTYRCTVCHEWHIGNSTATAKNKRPRFEPVCDWSHA